MSRSIPGRPRSLADQLRRMDDDTLVQLLLARPDALTPIPPDLTTIAARLAGRAGVQRVVDSLDTPTVQVLEILAVLPEPTTPGQVSALWGGPATDQLSTLRRLALIWGSPRAIHLVRAARDLLGPFPAGLGPPLAEALGRRSPSRLFDLVSDLGLEPTADPHRALEQLAEHLGSADVVTTLLAEAPDGARAVLDRLTWDHPVGRVPDADRPVRTATGGTAVEWLLARGLLAVADPGHVVLPREVALVLRGGRVHRERCLVPPELRTVSRPGATTTGATTTGAMIAGAAATAAAEAVRLVEALGHLWSQDPPAVLRTGGLGVRELRRVASALEIADADAARVIELTYACGLVADDAQADPRWGPTPRFDEWLPATVAERWTVLAQAWLTTTRCPALVGTRDAKDGVRTPLRSDLHRPAAPATRRAVLELLVEAGGEVTASDLVARLNWAAPRRAGQRDELVGWALAEGNWLGVLGSGAPTPMTQALLDDDPPRCVAELARALPAMVDHILLQADLTAIAPGPAVPELARELALLAEVDSRGGATVYRFTPGSVRRALDAGRTADDILALLTRHSRTAVPQPLEYLVRDAARRHGRVRVGAAQAYLRCDDAATLAELLADRRTAALRLRRLAPTVLAAQATPQAVLSVLREIGAAPAAEGPDGELVITGPTRFRVPARPVPAAGPAAPPAPAAGSVLNLVRVLRLADAPQTAGTASSAAPAAPPGAGPTTTDPPGVLLALREAAAQRRALWIGYIDAAGAENRRLIEPIAVEAGGLVAFDRVAEQVRTFAVHRVSAVRAAVDG